MKKKYIYFILIFIVILSIFGWRYLVKEDEKIIIFETKLIEGKIESVVKSNISINVEKYWVNPELNEERIIIENLSFILSDKTIFIEEQKEAKSDEECKREIQEYTEWKKIPDTEKDVYGFKFSPSCKNTIDISSSDLKIGDTVNIFYYSSGEENIAVKVYKNNVNEYAVEKSLDLVADFFSEIQEIADEYLEVKLVNNIFDKYKDGESVKLIINDNTILKRRIEKSNEEYTDEKKRFEEEKIEIKNNNGNILNLIAPSRYTEEVISLLDFKKGDIIKVKALVQEGAIIANVIEKTIKN